MHTQETEKLCSWMYLLKENQVQQFVKFMILSTSCMHVNDLSRPVEKTCACSPICWTAFELLHNTHIAISSWVQPGFQCCLWRSCNFATLLHKFCNFWQSNMLCSFELILLHCSNSEVQTVNSNSAEVYGIKQNFLF